MGGCEALLRTGTPLPEERIGENALQLIEEFKVALVELPAFQVAIADVYFGENEDGKISPEDARRVGFWNGNVWWQVEYRFSKGAQALIIVRHTWHDETVGVLESVELRSARSQNVSPRNPSVSYLFYSSLPGSSKKPTIEENTDFAFQNARRLLNDLRFSSGQ